MKAGLFMVWKVLHRAERLARMIQIRKVQFDETIEKIDVKSDKVRTYAENVVLKLSLQWPYGPISSAPSLQELMY